MKNFKEGQIVWWIDSTPTMHKLTSYKYYPVRIFYNKFYNSDDLHTFDVLNKDGTDKTSRITWCYDKNIFETLDELKEEVGKRIDDKIESYHRQIKEIEEVRTIVNKVKDIIIGE